MTFVGWLIEALKFVAAAVIGAIAVIIVEEILGPKLRVPFAAWRKRVGRFFRDDPVTGILQMRLDAVSPSSEDDTNHIVEEVLRAAGATDVSHQIDMTRASLRQGRTIIQIRVVPVHCEPDEEDSVDDRGDKVESLSVEMTCLLSYRRFYDTLPDLTAMADKLAEAFAQRQIVVDPKSKAFAIDISTLPELAGFFAVLRTESFSARIRDGETRLDYHDRRLEVKGPLDSSTLRAIRDAILFGF